MAGLYRIVYTSHQTIQGSDEDRVAGVATVLSSGRERNDRADLTSVLALHRGRFAQIIEGGREAAEATFARILGDRRHRDIQVLESGPVEARSFPGCALALIGHSARGRSRLDELARRSGSDIGLAEPSALLDAFVDVLAQETAARETAKIPSEPGADAERDALDAVFATAVFSADRRILRANARFETLFGYGRGDLAGIDLGALVHGGDRGRLDDLWAAMARGRPVSLDHRGTRRGGAEVWLRSRFTPRLDAAGALRDVVEIASDVTEAQRQQAGDSGQIAVTASQAVVHFTLDGIVEDANPVFLDAMGYRRDEIVGRHHRIFVDPMDRDGADHAALWAELAQGRHQAADYRRIGKDGRPVWLQATYNPIFDTDGRPFKVVQYATVVSDAKLRQADFQWQIAAVHNSQVVVTFDMSGVVLDANATFLDASGYTLDALVGRHHRMFVEPGHAHGPEYARFWRELARGRYQSGEFRRFGRDGREMWLQATYNPVFDMNGVPVKVVKCATVITDEKLRQADHQGQIAALHKAQCVIAYDLDGTILDANDNVLDLLGYRLADVRGASHRMLVTPEEACSDAYAALWADLGKGHLLRGEYKRIGRDGREVWWKASYNPIVDMNGRPFRVVEYATDITADKLQRIAFEGQIDAIRKSQAIITFDMAGTILDINDMMLASLGHAREALLGRHHSVLVDPAQVDTPDYATFWDTLRAGTFLSGLYERRGKDGRTVWFQASYNPILDLNGRPLKVLKIASDVSSQVVLAEAYEDARRQTQHDSATALPNRVRLSAFLTSALTPPCGRVVVLYMDIDGFKAVNLAFGHAAGDRALGDMADRLRRCLSNDQLAARVGGDEFVVVAPDLPDDEIAPFCQRLLDAAAVPIVHDGEELALGLSIGVAIAPMDGTTPDQLLRCADAALQRSKQGGRGTFTFYAAAMNDRILAYRALVDDMRRGLAADEFFLEYQPRFAPRDRRLQSVEALVRWRHPQRGRVNPADFIPLAEKSGLIVQLGTWVLRTACHAAAAWDGIGVSVNVSPVQFRSAGLVPTVMEALTDAGLDPHRLELEITEGVLLENAERAGTELNALKALGVKLAMDDFGTGYSSLSSLRSFPFDVIKIDRNFVADMDVRKGGREVVQAILGLGRALGLSVTAEGVETPAQLMMLTLDGCQEVQGFLLARPMAVDAITERLVTGEPAILAEQSAAWAGDRA